MFDSSKPPTRILLCALAALVATTAALPASLRVLEAGGLPAEAAALLMSEESGGRLTLQATAIPRAIHPRGEVDLEITLQARGADVVDGQGDPARLEVFAYVLDARNALRGSLLKVIEIEGRNSRDRVASSGIEYQGAVRLPPGEYSLRVLARNPASSAVGLRRLTVEIPGGSGVGTNLFPPLFDEPAEAWVRVSDTNAESDRQGTRLIVAGRRSLWPVISGEAERPYEVLAHSLGERDELRLELTPRSDGGGWGEPILLDTPVLARHQPARGWTRISSRVAPGEIAPGNYRVRMVAGDKKPVRSADLPLFSSPLPTGGTQVWASLLERPQEAVESRSEVPSNPGASQLGVPRGELRAELRGVFEHLGDGRHERAIERLTTVQERALRGSGVVIDTLRDLEVDFVRGLTGGAPESLRPIVDFYLAVFLDQLATGKRLLSSHNRLLLVELTELEVKRRSSPQAARHAADTLIRLATASSHRLTTHSERLYLQALELDPANETALLSLITGYERRTDYDSAIALLRRLLRKLPDHREGRLRLAVNLNRTREPRAARQLLVDLTRSGPPDWVRAVAYQELANHYLSQGQTESAGKLLAAARAVFPDDEKLRLLEAFVLDERQQPRRAGKLLELQSENRASPRFIYGQGLGEILDRVGGPSTGAGEQEMEALRQALAAAS